MAAGSVRNYDAGACAGRGVVFSPFGVIEGLDEDKSKSQRLTALKLMGFSPCNFFLTDKNSLKSWSCGHFAESLYCPCCDQPTRIDTSGSAETLRCDNPACATQILRKFAHFVGKKAMDIDGLSEATLEKFIRKGWLREFTDIYRLDKYEWEICVMTEGFGEKSWRRLWDAIQRSRNTTFERFVVAMDIPVVGRTASRELCRQFDGDLTAFEVAVIYGFDFTQLKDFGETLHRNIHDWFTSEDNRKLWKELQSMTTIENKGATTVTEATGNPFSGRTIVVTGKLEHFTRGTINAKIGSLGAIAVSATGREV